MKKLSDAVALLVLVVAAVAATAGALVGYYNKPIPVPSCPNEIKVGDTVLITAGAAHGDAWNNCKVREVLGIRKFNTVTHFWVMFDKCPDADGADKRGITSILFGNEVMKDNK